MKCVIFLSALVAVTSAGVLHSAPLLAAPAILSTGQSAQFRSQDNAGNYAFGYNEDHATGGTFRRESGNGHGGVVGSYGLRDADGRLRIVNYVADDNGFRADIQTNEPGTEPKPAASTTVNGAIVDPALTHGPAIHAPLVAHAAPLAYAPSHGHLAAAPVHHAPAHYAAPLHHAPAHYGHLAAAPVHHAPAHYAVPHHSALLASPSLNHYAYASPFGHFY